MTENRFNGVSGDWNRIIEALQAIGRAGLTCTEVADAFRALGRPAAVITSERGLSSADLIRIQTEYSSGYRVPVLEHMAKREDSEVTRSWESVKIRPSVPFRDPVPPGKRCSYCGRRRTGGDQCPGCGAPEK